MRRRAVLPVVAISLAAVVGACAAPRSPLELLLPDADRADPALRDACLMTADHCTRCHTLERVLTTRVDHPVHWRRHVDRMRRMRSSGIRPDEADAIVRCLVHRSFGSGGLDALGGEPAAAPPPTFVWPDAPPPPEPPREDAWPGPQESP